jgi:hypothetical protein
MQRDEIGNAANPVHSNREACARFGAAMIFSEQKNSFHEETLVFRKSRSCAPV